MQHLSIKIEAIRLAYNSGLKLSSFSLSFGLILGLIVINHTLSFLDGLSPGIVELAPELELVRTVTTYGTSQYIYSGVHKQYKNLLTRDPCQKESSLLGSMYPLPNAIRRLYRASHIFRFRRTPSEPIRISQRKFHIVISVYELHC